ncbi:uncharacterized protein KY384_001249 [Bacidia gigantensis]|uniref:uncharacterized protein n=1 Tax=Bacidia gigantensis TaxID=2732470 RepID=UPI001D04D9F7|nr:uncharacterized protein KY384_001249 [Bacidia gigantensis]KAG8534404.1 hypothetical protein KY384_001249 [Bacidia gigantensis]
MRLLNTRTSEFKEINSHHGLKYAILSHRWSEQEVSYEEMQKGTALEGLGLSKIRHFCRLAADKGFDWAWELLAPQEILFFDADWNEMGSLSDYATDVSEITRIACHYLFSNYERALYPKPKREIQFASVAERMSWASYRVTSKEEDIAYCLLGLFGVNVSLLYGEGAGMAFRRLQIEIMNDRRTNQSLLGFRMKKDPACLHPIHAVSEDLETFSVISNSRIQSEGCIQ